VLVIGGLNAVVLNNTELYDPSTGLWRFASSMNNNVAVHTASVLRNGKVLVAGGYNGTVLNNCELYQP